MLTKALTITQPTTCKTGLKKDTSWGRATACVWATMGGWPNARVFVEQNWYSNPKFWGFFFAFIYQRCCQSAGLQICGADNHPGRCGGPAGTADQGCGGLEVHRAVERREGRRRGLSNKTSIKKKDLLWRRWRRRMEAKKLSLEGFFPDIILFHMVDFRFCWLCSDKWGINISYNVSNFFL